MTEPPDVDRIARTLVDVTLFVDRGPLQVGTVITDDFKQRFAALIAEQLRLVWNARGAADAQAVEEKLATLTGWVTSEPYRQHLKDAIEALNR